MRKFAQFFLPVYALVLIYGGIKGYQQKSNESLYAGAGSGLVCLILTALSAKYPRISLGIAAVIAAILTGVMGWRFEKTGKLVPPGLIMAVSALATGITGFGATQRE
jgi:uncharacterized membrane protein (UPF0136 family)